MANKIRWPMKIEANTFQEFREQFNERITSLLRQMVDGEVEAAKVSCTFDIKLIPGQAVDATTGELINFLQPQVMHKITTTIQRKEEETGGFGSANDKLVWNDRAEQYEIVPITTGQRSMFEEDEE